MATGRCMVDNNNNGIVDMLMNMILVISLMQIEIFGLLQMVIYDQGEYFEDWGQDGIHNTG